MRSLCAWILLAGSIAGCGESVEQPAFSDLNPTSGVVQQGGKPVSGGAVQFSAEPAQPEFLVNSEVDDAGRFTLTTVRTTDSQGERRPGAPAGQYRVTYTPPSLDQTAGYKEPLVKSKTVTIAAGSNDLRLEFPGGR